MSDVKTPEPGTIVLLSVVIEATLAEKTPQPYVVGTFADATSPESAERRLKNLLEDAFFDKGILANVEVTANPQDDDTFDAEFVTDTDPGDEDEPTECCGLDTPCYDCPVEPEPESLFGGCMGDLGPEKDDANYITLKLTPVEAAAVRVLTGMTNGSGPARTAVNTIHKSLREFTGEDIHFDGDLNRAIIASVVVPLTLTDNGNFQRVVTAYERALSGSNLEPIQQLCYSSSRPDTRRVM